MKPLLITLLAITVFSCKKESDKPVYNINYFIDGHATKFNYTQKNTTQSVGEVCGFPYFEDPAKPGKHMGLIEATGYAGETISVELWGDKNECSARKIKSDTLALNAYLIKDGAQISQPISIIDTSLENGRLYIKGEFKLPQ